MFNLIVAVLSIALVGITAGASVYYGGTAFSNSNNRGQVSSLISAGGQIAAAQSLHRTEKGGVAATDLTTVDKKGLIDLNYLQAQPSVPTGLDGAGVWTIVDGGAMAVLMIDPNSAPGSSAELVCKKVVEEGGAYLRHGTTAEDAVTYSGNLTNVSKANFADATNGLKVANTLNLASDVDFEGFNDGRRVNFACLEMSDARYFAYRI